MKKANFRFYIQIRKTLDLKSNEIFQGLRTANRSKAPSLSTEKYWSTRFSRSKNNLGDWHRRMDKCEYSDY